MSALNGLYVLHNLRVISPPTSLRQIRLPPLPRSYDGLPRPGLPSCRSCIARLLNRCVRVTVCLTLQTLMSTLAIRVNARVPLRGPARFNSDRRCTLRFSNIGQFDFTPPQEYFRTLILLGHNPGEDPHPPRAPTRSVGDLLLDTQWNIESSETIFPKLLRTTFHCVNNLSFTPSFELEPKLFL